MIKTNKRNKKRRTIELTIGDIACFVKPHSDFIYHTIVRDIVPKRHNIGLESPTVFVLITDDKFDFYNIIERANKKYIGFHNTSIGSLFDNRFRKEFRKSKSLVTVFFKSYKGS